MAFGGYSRWKLQQASVAMPPDSQLGLLSSSQLRRQGHLSRSCRLVRGRARVQTLVCLLPMPVPFSALLGFRHGPWNPGIDRTEVATARRKQGPGASCHTECQSAAGTGELRDPRVLTRGGSAFSFSASVRIMQESHDESPFTAGHPSIVQKQ